MHHIVFSPHADDAVLSLGGHLRAWRAADEQVTVVTVFSISDVAFGKQGSVAYVSALRTEEDRAALAPLGIELVHLDLPDAPLRGYSVHPGSAGTHPSQVDERRDATCMQKLEERIRAQLDEHAIHYFPLGYPEHGHVDHQLVHRVGAMLLSSYRCCFYEDLPYATRYPEPLTLIEELALTPGDRTVDISPKVELLTYYASQIEPSYIEAVKGHRVEVGARAIERLWFPR
ncbi:hypothetical protein GVX82_02375 [Patescibacteria group bacterium]|jgi:LmbE family N-acetylglucosaminyl deacetylase|nr:hypothetical protein [Patescibacteria group bacterium]